MDLKKIGEAKKQHSQLDTSDLYLKLSYEQRTDYEIVVLEGQRYFDLFQEIGLPMFGTGSREIHVEILGHKKDFDLQDVSGVSNNIYDSLSKWGFLERGKEHKLSSKFIRSNKDCIKIYTN